MEYHLQNYCAPKVVYVCSQADEFSRNYKLTSSLCFSRRSYCLVGHTKFEFCNYHITLLISGFVSQCLKSWPTIDGKDLVPMIAEYFTFDYNLLKKNKHNCNHNNNKHGNHNINTSKHIKSDKYILNFNIDFKPTREQSQFWSHIPQWVFFQPRNEFDTQNSKYSLKYTKSSCQRSIDGNHTNININTTVPSFCVEIRSGLESARAIEIGLIGVDKKWMNSKLKGIDLNKENDNFDNTIRIDKHVYYWPQMFVWLQRVSQQTCVNKNKVNHNNIDGLSGRSSGCGVFNYNYNYNYYSYYNSKNSEMKDNWMMFLYGMNMYQSHCTSNHSGNYSYNRNVNSKSIDNYIRYYAIKLFDTNIDSAFHNDKFRRINIESGSGHGINSYNTQTCYFKESIPKPSNNTHGSIDYVGRRLLADTSGDGQHVQNSESARVDNGDSIITALIEDESCHDENSKYNIVFAKNGRKMIGKFKTVFDEKNIDNFCFYNVFGFQNGFHDVSIIQKYVALDDDCIKSLKVSPLTNVEAEREGAKQNPKGYPCCVL